MPEPQKLVPVTDRALMQRINRKLRSKNQVLKTSRSVRAKAGLGRFYIVDFNGGGIVHQHVGIEALGRELGALQAYERLVFKDDPVESQ